MIVVALVVAGCGGGEERRPAVPAATSAATPPARTAPIVEHGALLGTVTPWDGSGSLLAPVDRRTLEPGFPWAELGEYHGAWSMSPDGRMAAFGISAPGKAARIGVRVIDLRTLETVQDLELGVVAETVGWLEPDRLVAFLQFGEMVVVDPLSGEEVGRRAMGAVSCPFGNPSAVTPLGFVMLLAIAGTTHLVLVDAQGRVQTRELPRIAAGETFGFCAGASLAVDRRRLVAYVVGAHAPVAEVDLRTLAVRDHRLAAPPRLLTARGCRGCGADLDAVWLGDGRLAVAGYHLRPSGPRRKRVRPAGAVVISTRSWSARPIAARAGGLVRAGAHLLVFDGRHPSGRGRGGGLRVHDRSGRLRYTVLRGERVGDVQRAGSRAYARTTRGLRVVDLRSGRVIERLPRTRRDVQLLTRP